VSLEGAAKYNVRENQIEPKQISKKKLSYRIQSNPIHMLRSHTKTLPTILTEQRRNKEKWNVRKDSGEFMEYRKLDVHTGYFIEVL
jgi:hypothetical protein